MSRDRPKCVDNMLVTKGKVQFSGERRDSKPVLEQLAIHLKKENHTRQEGLLRAQETFIGEVSVHYQDCGEDCTSVKNDQLYSLTRCSLSYVRSCL